jgi:hypothetical protein
MVREDASVPAVQWFLAIGFYFATILAFALAIALEQEETATLQIVNAIHAASAVVQALRESRKRSRSSSDDDDNEERPRKKRYIRYDRERARNCVRHDYVGPSPLFDDKQFERVFRITRTMYESVRHICCQADSFFRAGLDCTKRMAIDVDVKILCGLKLLAYGVSGSAFQDYFQIGETTALLCCEKVSHIISTLNFILEV